MTNAVFHPGTRSAAILHLSPLVPTAIAVAIVGNPAGWIGLLFPFGPLVNVVVARATGRTVHPTWRLALAFSLVASTIVGGSWLFMRLSEEVPLLSLAFPLALLAFFLGLINAILVCFSRAYRAWKSVPLKYPWIPGWLDAPLRIDPILKEM